jgi:hypothetical protein
MQTKVLVNQLLLNRIIADAYHNGLIFFSKVEDWIWPGKVMESL